jgi:WD40 repeat protein
VASGRKVLGLKSDHRIDHLALSPDGRTLAAACFDRTVRLWDVATGTEMGGLNGHRDIVTAVAFSPDGKSLASGSCDGTILVWDATWLTLPKRARAAGPPARKP